MKKKLSAQYLNSNLDAGRYYDDNGTGLNIHVRKSGSKNWSQRLRINGKQIELGLGSYPIVPLTEARSLAAKNKALSAQGINPKTHKVKPTIIPTFAEIADTVLEIKNAELTNEKHKAQWRSTLEQYAYPTIGSLPVNQITVDHIHSLLEAIWLQKTETASRLRGRIQVVLNYAIVKKMMSAPNPATWDGNLSALLPSKSKATKPKQQPALQLKDAQRWWKELKLRDGNGARALMFLTLAASRSGEVRGMTWEEIDLFSQKEAEQRGFVGIWTIPAIRMKANREHRIPITKGMLRLIEGIKLRKGFVFCSDKNTELSNMTLSSTMKRMHFSDQLGFVDAKSQRSAVPHGLRSTFRTWAAENKHSREAAELQLAHKFGNNVEHAYYRTDIIDERAQLLMKWHAFLEGKA
ncbi:integrase arm-type DNA-binding domain-containing protein [Amylibacter sp.]|nr:integrase arm-type DNA-binding domain-containing protein [Amylibacter sp.]